MDRYLKLLDLTPTTRNSHQGTIRNHVRASVAPSTAHRATTKISATSAKTISRTRRTEVA